MIRIIHDRMNTILSFSPVKIQEQSLRATGRAKITDLQDQFARLVEKNVTDLQIDDIRLLMAYEIFSAENRLSVGFLDAVEYFTILLCTYVSDPEGVCMKTDYVAEKKFQEAGDQNFLKYVTGGRARYGAPDEYYLALCEKCYGLLPHEEPDGPMFRQALLQNFRTCAMKLRRFHKDFSEPVLERVV